MKGYLIKRTENNPYYWPDEHHVCIHSKLHMRYYRRQRDGIWGGRAGDVSINPDLCCFSLCDGKRCIDSLFKQWKFTDEHPLPPDVQLFLQEVVRKKAKEEIPERFVPFVQRALAGEDPKKVHEEMIETRPLIARY